MSKTRVTVFVCTGKDCARAWCRLCDGSPGKWLKRHVEASGLPYKLTTVKTECMDRCDHAGCLCFQHGSCAAPECDIRSEHDADRLLAALRSCVEAAEPGTYPRISRDAGRR
jgi:predicted metal-binding protein